MLDIQDDISSYLAFSHYIDWNEPSVQRKAKELKDSTEGEIELAKAAYYFVRDEIKHSWDVQDKRVTATASDALREGVGICWAKSNLLAALLRANGIPAGICYQRLTLGSTPESGYCIHALNAIYLRSISSRVWTVNGACIWWISLIWRTTSLLRRCLLSRDTTMPASPPSKFPPHWRPRDS